MDAENIAAGVSDLTAAIDRLTRVTVVLAQLELARAQRRDLIDPLSARGLAGRLKKATP